MPELKALIFDLDGSLADNEHDGHRVPYVLPNRRRFSLLVAAGAQ